MKIKTWGVFTALFFSLMVVSPSSVRAAIVYDNTSSSLGFFTGLGNFWRGDEITLSGTERVVTDFQFGHFGFGTGPQGIVRFYANDGPSDAPGTVLFESAPFNFQLNGDNDFIISGLSVLVPGTFTWAVHLHNSVGLRLYDPPTIGTSDDFHWFSSDGASWSQINFATNIDNFRARITAVAVPEPQLVGLLAIGLAGLGNSRRKRA